MEFTYTYSSQIHEFSVYRPFALFTHEMNGERISGYYIAAMHPSLCGKKNLNGAKYSWTLYDLTPAMRQSGINLFTSVSCTWSEYSGWKCKSVLVFMQKECAWLPVVYTCDVLKVLFLATQNASIVSGCSSTICFICTYVRRSML